MVATHWNKGWIIENNVISNSKCSGITLGKERNSGHNKWLSDTSIDGSLHYIEVTFNAIREGWTKRQFNGAEIGGIKFHAALDARIAHNRIHNTGRALWLDWMTQGTHVSSNLFYGNDLEDIFLEVNHGPFLVENNILASHRSILEQSQGGAYVHNLICGKIHNYVIHLTSCLILQK